MTLTNTPHNSRFETWPPVTLVAVLWLLYVGICAAVIVVLAVLSVVLRRSPWFRLRRRVPHPQQPGPAVGVGDLRGFIANITYDDGSEEKPPED
jgi:hypothetical protein